MKENEIAIAVFSGLICVVILALVMNSTPPSNGIDQNTSIDQNIQIKTPPVWCYTAFLHRRPVLKINVTKDGITSEIGCKEAEEKGYITKGSPIYAENIDVNGIYCECAVYFELKNAYEKICLSLKDQNAIETCFETPTADLNKFIVKDENHH